MSHGRCVDGVATAQDSPCRDSGLTDGLADRRVEMKYRNDLGCDFAATPTDVASTGHSSQRSLIASVHAAGRRTNPLSLANETSGNA